MKLNSVIKNKLSLQQVYSLSFLLAFCSFYFELSLAQLLSSLLGGTYLQYAITIGLFTFSLGSGSLLYEKLKSKYSFLRIFLATEFLIIIVIFSTPWMMILLSHRNLTLLLYLPIIFIGILTGIELPSLIDQHKEKTSTILGLDYFGMITSSLVFPLLLFPKVGILPGLFIVSFINFASLSSFIKQPYLKWSSYLFCLLMMIAIWINYTLVNSWSSYLLELRYD